MRTAGTVNPAPLLAPRVLPGCLAALIVCSIYGGLALSVDFPKAAMGIQSDEATYYLMAHSLVADADLAYRQQDLQRAFREFPSGPSGLFLKEGRTVTGVGLSARPPFISLQSRPDSDLTRLYFGKAFIYPVFAAPFVWLLGTNGFLVLHALLLASVTIAGYAFLSTKSPPAVALLLSTGFVFASVVPVYFVWITPELFNFSLGLLAYFCWLYKRVAPAAASRLTGWLRTGTSDLVAAVLLGIASYSKVSNAIAFVPLVVWLAWRREWRHAARVIALWTVVTAGLFAINVAITGDWNYQGGERRTFYDHYAFERPGVGFEVGATRGRDEALGGIIFDRAQFWTNLRANLWYYLAGRNAGLIPYFFPGVFAILAFLASRRTRLPWQWLVFAGAIGQMLFFIVTQPYTYIGSGGSVGNRYFMGAYGLLLFLLPPVRSVVVAAVPWLVGGLFVGSVVLNPFYSSVRPAERTKSGPLRIFPVELTNINDLPMDTEGSGRVMVWYGDNPGVGDPSFQIYHLDDNAYLRELDKSFWVRGEARAEVLIKTDRPFRRLQLTLTAGPVPTEATATVGGRTQVVRLESGASREIVFDLGPGFPYKKDRAEPAYVWSVSVASSHGFTPILFDPASNDIRYLGVRVKPVIVP